MIQAAEAAFQAQVSLIKQATGPISHTSAKQHLTGKGLPDHL